MAAAMAAAVAALAVVVAMRGERRVPLRVLGEEALGRAFFAAPLRRRLFPSFLGVLRMLKVMDWRRSACLPTAGAAFFWASVVLCLRPSCRSRSRSRGVMGRGKQLVGFLDSGVPGPWWGSKETRLRCRVVMPAPSAIWVGCMLALRRVS